MYVLWVGVLDRTMPPKYLTGATSQWGSTASAMELAGRIGFMGAGIVYE